MTRAGWPALLTVLMGLLLSGCAELDAVAAPATDEPTTSAPSVVPAAPRKTATPTPEVTASPSPTQQPTPTPTQQPTPTPTQKPRRTALAQLATLVVKGRAPMTGYDRVRFGQAWLDADRNGCDTRNDLLRRDLSALVVREGTQGCVVERGVLADPYTGVRIEFVRGDGTLVDIDHVVSLGNAWASGSASVDVRRRAAFANDPLNLLAVDAGANRSKSDSNAASWLPPNRTYRCAYVARQVAVKAKYRLAVTEPERAAIARVLTGCAGQPVTRDLTHAPTRVDQFITDLGPPAPSPAPRPTAPVPLAQAPSGSVYYENCDAARAAGAAPVRRGDPGYASHLDRDGDGSGCE